MNVLKGISDTGLSGTAKGLVILTTRILQLWKVIVDATILSVVRTVTR